MASPLGILLSRRPSPDNDGAVFVQVLREEDVSDAMLTALGNFAAAFGFEGVAVDELGPVCTASISAYRQTYVLWMAWVPGFDEIQLADQFNEEDGYLYLARGRPVTVLTEEDFVTRMAEP